MRLKEVKVLVADDFFVHHLLNSLFMEFEQSNISCNAEREMGNKWEED